MDGIIAYILCKKLMTSITAGISDIEVSGQELIITTNDGKILTMTFPTPKDGISITSIIIDEKKHLICTLSDGTIIDAGEVPKGVDGKDGVSIQTIEINEDKHLIVTLSDGTIQDAGSVLNEDFATEEEIDALFNDEGETSDLSDIEWATNSDIDELFSDETGDSYPTDSFATEEDIDELFDEGGTT